MSRSVRLRPWQHAALARYQASPHPDFLAVATPGAGKTTFALTALRTALARRPARVVVVAPTAHLKVQWAAAAAGLGLHLDPAWSPSDGGMPPDMHGVITSYQQVALSAPELRGLSRGAYVILDEVHHAGEEQAWGDALRHAFGESGRRLSLSGTPFRSDTRAIPFVRYEADEAVPDFEYGYGDALRDGRVVRPVYFPRVGGEMEWSAPDGAVHGATFDDPLANQLANQRLRTALSIDGEWLPTVLGDAVARLDDVRRHQPDAGGLVIAMDQEHAKGIAQLLRREIGRPAVVVTSDDPDASKRITEFGASKDPWLVAVRMVSEGVDVPRLRVGVYATTVTTDLFFRQAVGRFVRWVPGIRDQRAWLFIPDDLRLRIRASEIAEARRHSLRKVRRDDEDDPQRSAGPDENVMLGDQLSLFAALSAVVAGDGSADSPWHEPLPDEWSDGHDPSIEFELGPPPPLMAPPDGEAGITRREYKDRLRVANAEAAKDIARVSGLSYAAVNLELNRSAGIRRVTEATADQLQVRLGAARRWQWRLGK
ncbi:MAG TPA: DEAD/DEAH box helicase family protein [Candidatus Limnocylindrales bacterium]|nr:DEAD/DEAH box helicase family protein [Candidatus Limnocylindrales bacterium]